MSERPVPEELIRDLVQCVQAARDGAEDGSLFALQCDLVLARTTREAPELLKKRAIEQSHPRAWKGTALQLEFEIK